MTVLDGDSGGRDVVNHSTFKHAMIFRVGHRGEMMVLLLICGQPEATPRINLVHLLSLYLEAIFHMQALQSQNDGDKAHGGLTAS